MPTRDELEADVEQKRAALATARALLSARGHVVDVAEAAGDDAAMKLAESDLAAARVAEAAAARALAEAYEALSRV